MIKQRRARFRFVQFRMWAADAIRLRQAAMAADQSVQNAMIEAVNLYLAKHNQPPAPNPGSWNKKHADEADTPAASK